MSSDLAISVRGLGKSYVIEHKQEHSSIAEAFLSRLRSPFRKTAVEEIWAMQDVSFDVPRGDIVGLLGRNGAGKSTLLKLLSRITAPTTGEAKITGRIASLIEVGTGFQPELTGRENIFLNGAILGMRRQEIRRRFDEIVDFSGVEKFLDTPVKRYSSGMYVRLAFAVAAHLDADILLVDEVLSVGDAEFQKKSLGKMESVAHSGRTVLFVSHDMAALEALCNTGLVFDRGRLVKTAPLKEALAEYHRIAKPNTDTSAAIVLDDRYRHFRRVDIVDETGESTRTIAMGSQLQVRAIVESEEPLDYPCFIVRIDNSKGQRMLTARSPRNHLALPRLSGRHELVCNIQNLPFSPGEYSLRIALGKDLADIEEVETEIAFTVRNADTFGDGWGARQGFCVAPSEWRMTPKVSSREVPGHNAKMLEENSMHSL